MSIYRKTSDLFLFDCEVAIESAPKTNHKRT